MVAAVEWRRRSRSGGASAPAVVEVGTLVVIVLSFLLPVLSSSTPLLPPPPLRSMGPHHRLLPRPPSLASHQCCRFPPWRSMREGRPQTVNRFRDHRPWQVIVDTASTASPPPSHSMQEGCPPHVDRCRGRRARPAIATILRGTPGNPILPPTLPPPPLSPSRPPQQLEGKTAPRTTPRTMSRGSLPLRRLARSNPRSLPGRSLQPRHRRQRHHRLFASRRHDHNCPSRHTTICDPILRRQTLCWMEVAMIA